MVDRGCFCQIAGKWTRHWVTSDHKWPVVVKYFDSEMVEGNWAFGHAIVFHHYVDQEWAIHLGYGLIAIRGGWVQYVARNNEHCSLLPVFANVQQQKYDGFIT
ncbi:MAG: hypothetical protein AABO41_27220 [Acidobacteriota bacterium]